MKKVLLLLGACALIAGGVAVAALATPPTGGPPGQGECEHGNSGQECKPDPQPGHGQDCDEHGPKNGGVNEDHCTPTTTTGTTPTDTIPTTTVPTTPTSTTPTPRCPPGEGPFAGKDGQSGNDECCPDSDNNQQCDLPTPPTETVRTQPPATVTPQSTTAPLATKVTTKPLAKPKPKAARKPLAHKANKPVKLTGNPKVDKCKDLGNGTMKCKGVIVTPGQG